jgi:S-adenosylmethionine:tRNA ribosyltransferase-isomerase
VPLPPYIKRTADDADKESYQTIYSKAEGSVAAPTAGLHFTEAIFEALRAKGIQDDFVTLHVGAGTFKPVKAEQMADHEMHAEWIDVRIELLERLKDALQSDRKIIAVGTTATRTLESLYWLGVKAYLNPQMDIAELTIKQWDVYEITAALSSADALGTLIAYLKSKGYNKVMTKTQLLIAPGYAWKIVDRLVTNFHQPDSTLLLLVAAFIGDDWHKVYEYALAHNFRFLSYGDGCLLKRN